MCLVNIVAVQNSYEMLVLKLQHVAHVKLRIIVNFRSIHCEKIAAKKQEKDYKSYQSDDFSLGYHKVNYEIKEISEMK